MKKPPPVAPPGNDSLLKDSCPKFCFRWSSRVKYSKRIGSEIVILTPETTLVEVEMLMSNLLLPLLPASSLFHSHSARSAGSHLLKQLFSKVSSTKDALFISDYSSCFQK